MLLFDVQDTLWQWTVWSRLYFA